MLLDLSSPVSWRVTEVLGRFAFFVFFGCFACVARKFDLALAIVELS